MKLMNIIVNLVFSIIINTTVVASTKIFVNDVEDVENGQSRLSGILHNPGTLIVEKNRARSLEFRSRSADNDICFDYIFGNQSQPYEDKSQGIDIGGKDMEVDNLVENEFTNTVMRDEPIEVDDNDILRMNKPITAGDKPILIDVWGKIKRDSWVMSTNDDICIGSCVDDSLINSIRVTPNSDGGPCVLTMNMDFERNIYHFKFYNIMMVEIFFSSSRDILFRSRDMHPYSAFES